MQINNSLTPQQNLLALINEANTAQVLDLSQIAFGPPHQTGSEPAGHNTTVTVTAINGSGYAGSQDVMYQRINLDQAVVAPSTIVPIPDSATNTQDTINAVTAHFGLIADEFSLNAAQSTRPPDGTLQLPATLSPNTGSYVYAGADVAISLQWNALPSQSILLLDQVSTTASVALSLRQLRAGYPGPAIKVRRDSDNTTMDIGFVNGNLDVATLQAFVGTGNAYVQTWYDQSGSSNDATQTTPENQPSILVAANSSQLSFTGYFTGLNLATPLPDTWDLIVAGAPIDRPYLNKVLLPSPNGSVSVDAFGNSIQASSFESTIVWAANEAAVVHVSIQAANVGIAMNGQPPQTASTTGSQCPATSIGGAGYQPFGMVSEMLVFATPLVAADAATLQANMGAAHVIPVWQTG